MGLKDDLMFKNPGGYFWKFLVGVYRPVLQILTLFQTKNVIFHTRFSADTKLHELALQRGKLGSL